MFLVLREKNPCIKTDNPLEIGCETKTLRPPLPRPIKYQFGPLCIATLSCHGRVDPDLC